MLRASPSRKHDFRADFLPPELAGVHAEGASQMRAGLCRAGGTLRPVSCSSSQVAALAHDLDILRHPKGDDKEFQDYSKYALSRKMTGNGNT
jgi:hypothetical protein